MYTRRVTSDDMTLALWLHHCLRRLQLSARMSSHVTDFDADPERDEVVHPQLLVALQTVTGSFHFDQLCTKTKQGNGRITRCSPITLSALSELVFFFEKIISFRNNWQAPTPCSFLSITY